MHISEFMVILKELKTRKWMLSLREINWKLFYISFIEKVIKLGIEFWDAV